MGIFYDPRGVVLIEFDETRLSGTNLPSDVQMPSALWLVSVPLPSSNAVPTVQCHSSPPALEPDVPCSR